MALVNDFISIDSTSYKTSYSMTSFDLDETDVLYVETFPAKGHKKQTNLKSKSLAEVI